MTAMGRRVAPVVVLLWVAVTCFAVAEPLRPAGAQPPTAIVFPTPPPTQVFPTVPPDVPTPGPHTPTYTATVPTATATPERTGTMPPPLTDEPTPTGGATAGPTATIAPPIFVPYVARRHEW